MTELSAGVGAKWWKFDLHAHSPESFDFGGLEGVKSEVIVSFDDWLLTYMRAGIDAVVVADHNTHEGIDKARGALTSLRDSVHPDFRELAILAGVEVTAAGGTHVLGVFDTDTPAETINGLLHVCEFTGIRGASQATTKFSLVEVVAEIHARGGLAIPAHADNKMGLSRVDPRDQATLIASGQIAAVEITGGPESQPLETNSWIPVLGSDAHHLNGDGVPEGVIAKYPGSHFTWMKMSCPNLSGIRLALSDGGESVKTSEDVAGNLNQFTHPAIESISIARGADTVSHRFSPWMTAMIGGRGVGKSTVLELVRLALDRFEELPDSLRSDQAYFSPAPARGDEKRFWTTDTSVELVYLKNAQRYKVTWAGSEPTGWLIEVESDSGWVADEGYPSERFPILVYSQKQIYETAQDPQSLLRIVDAQPEVDALRWREEHHRLTSEYRRIRSAATELAASIESETRLKGELSDVEAALLAMQALKESPDRIELDQILIHESAISVREQRFEEFRRDLQTSLNRLKDGLPEEPILAASWDARRDRSDAEASAASMVSSAIELLQESEQRWSGVGDSSPLSTRAAVLRDLLKAEAGDSATDQGDLQESYERYISKQESLTLDLAAIERQKKGRADLLAQAAEVLGRIRAHRIELTEARRRYLDGLNVVDLKLSLNASSDDREFEAALRRIFVKPASFDQVFASPTGLRAALPESAMSPKWATALEDFRLGLLAMRRDGAVPAAFSSAGVSGVYQPFFTHIAGLDADAFEIEVNLWEPEDSLSVMYKDPNDGNLRSLNKGSPGQKTAALLAIILRMSSDPLLLDQPEDDLDNKLIYDLVVQSLRKIKTSRQVIVVTHNANVVVNADAELVLVMKHGELPQTSEAGSIQDVAVKNAICLIMEGGERAFDSRYKRLNPKLG